jgi:uncharacterized protein
MMLQRWRRLTFLHWRYEPASIQALLPPEIRVDTYAGAGWIGLTPFLCSVRLPFTPPLPWISRFPETNVRTYVIGPDGRRGVWFFTLEASRLLAVIGARLSFHLPYRWAKMHVRTNGQEVEYWSRRNLPFGRANTRIRIQPGEPMHPGEFDNFLTARYRLYTNYGKRIAYAQIEHKPWPLHTAKVLEIEQNLVERSGIPRPEGEPLAHFSPDLKVRVERLRLV